jgi:radical SAM protein with 4Fe4S-binding SPASM domain
MATEQVYNLKDNISIHLCSDGYIRVLKKHSYNRFAIEPLYAISKTQSVVLLLFSKPNTIQRASNYISQLYSIDRNISERIVSIILERYSGLLDMKYVDTCEIDDAGLDLKEIKRIIMSPILSPSTLSSPVKRKTIPESVVVFVSDSCMCDCIYCRVDAGICKQTPRFMALSTVSKIARECYELEIFDVELTGGDPLTHPQFIEILNIFKKYKVPVAFSTKSPIIDSKLIQIKEANVKMLQFSLDSIDVDTFVSLTGTSPKYFNNLYKTILNAVDLGFSIRIKSVITKLNISRFVNMIESLYSVGIKDFVLQQLSCGDREFSEELIPNVNEYTSLDRDMDTLVSKYSDIRIERAYSIETIFATETQKKYFRQDCMAGVNGIVIQVDGSFAYCGQSFNKELQFLNIKDIDIMSAWNSKELKDLLYPSRELFHGTLCYTCNDFENCMRKRCYIRTYRTFGKIFDVDPLCPHYMK